MLKLLPKLKLRGKIVGAAALVFVVAIVLSLFYVVHVDAKGRCGQCRPVAGQHGPDPGQEYRTGAQGALHQAANSIAQTIGDADAGSGGRQDSYVGCSSARSKSVPNAIGVWSLLDTDAPTASNPLLMASQICSAGWLFRRFGPARYRLGRPRIHQARTSRRQGFAAGSRRRWRWTVLRWSVLISMRASSSSPRPPSCAMASASAWAWSASISMAGCLPT